MSEIVQGNFGKKPPSKDPLAGAVQRVINGPLNTVGADTVIAGTNEQIDQAAPTDQQQAADILEAQAKIIREMTDAEFRGVYVFTMAGKKIDLVCFKPSKESGMEHFFNLRGALDGVIQAQLKNMANDGPRIQLASSIPADLPLAG